MVGFVPQSSLLLAAAISTVPFLVGYQVATLSDAQGNEFGRVLFALYSSVSEDALPKDQRPQFRDLLERVKHQYGDSDVRGRAVLVREYLEVATVDRSGKCAEIVLHLEHFTGLRYRVCNSPNQDVVRLVEDLTTPQRMFWLLTNPDHDVQEKVDAIVASYMPRFDEAFGDPAKVAELQAAIRSELESLSEEAGPGRSPFSVLEYEVGGGWEEVEVSDPDQEVEILSKLLAATSPEFSSRLARLLCLLKGLRDGAYPELASVFASYYPLVFGTIDLDLGRLPLACSPDDQNVNVMSGSIGSLPFQFLPVPEEVAKEYCAGGKWDPPRVNLSFEKRVERLQNGRGW